MGGSRCGMQAIIHRQDEEFLAFRLNLHRGEQWIALWLITGRIVSSIIVWSVTIETQ